MGRIAYISVTPPTDDPSPDPLAGGGVMPPPAEQAPSGWGPVILLALCLVAALAIGLWLIRR